MDSRGFRANGQSAAAEPLRVEIQGVRDLLMSFLESTRDGAAIVGWDHRIEYVNPALRKDLGEPGGRNCYEYLHDRGNPCTWCVKERVRRGEWVRRELYFAKLQRHYDLLEAPLDESGGITGGADPGSKLVLLRDVTERKLAEEALRVSERELQIRNRISEIFLSVPEEDVYSAVLDSVLAALRSKYGFFGYVDIDGAFVCPSMSRDVMSRCQIPQKSIVFPRTSWGGIWGRALIEKKTICQNVGPLKVPEGHIPLQRTLCVPIVFQDQILGELGVADKEAHYVREDIELLEDLATKVAPILHSRMQTHREHRARRRAEEALTQLRRQLRAEGSFAGIVGRDPKMLELFETIREVAAVDVPVLIQGESGTGKELVAAAIHSQGTRSERPFVPVNCSALPATLLESELFGHVKGSFTGAIRDKKGRFELADGGTIFLDEVGDLSAPIQVSLLRVLQEGTIERVGDERIREVDVRVISATNRDLRQLIASGKFREDLYYRLCVVPVSVPPLRERSVDIPLLADHVLKQVCAETGRQVTFALEAIDALCAHDWPGNVRELQNAIYYGVVKCKGSVLEVSALPPGIAAAAHAPPALGDSGASGATVVPAPSLGGAGDRQERGGKHRKLRAEDVGRALKETGGNKVEAARLLGVSRAALYKFFSRSAER